MKLSAAFLFLSTVFFINCIYAVQEPFDSKKPVLIVAVTGWKQFAFGSTVKRYRAVPEGAIRLDPQDIISLRTGQPCKHEVFVTGTILTSGDIIVIQHALEKRNAQQKKLGKQNRRGNKKIKAVK